MERFSRPSDSTALAPLWGRVFSELVVTVVLMLVFFVIVALVVAILVLSALVDLAPTPDDVVNQPLHLRVRPIGAHAALQFVGNLCPGLFGIVGMPIGGLVQRG